MTEAQLLTIVAAVLTAGQAASPEPERLSEEEAIAAARELWTLACRGANL